jgi:hypothetical protein
MLSSTSVRRPLDEKPVGVLARSSGNNPAASIIIGRVGMCKKQKPVQSELICNLPSTTPEANLNTVVQLYLFAPIPVLM